MFEKKRWEVWLMMALTFGSLETCGIVNICSSYLVKFGSRCYSGSEVIRYVMKKEKYSQRNQSWFLKDWKSDQEDNLEIQMRCFHTLKTKAGCLNVFDRCSKELGAHCSLPYRPRKFLTVMDIDQMSKISFWSYTSSCSLKDE
jgi:hypothetical protein